MSKPRADVGNYYDAEVTLASIRATFGKRLTAPERRHAVFYGSAWTLCGALADGWATEPQSLGLTADEALADLAAHSGCIRCHAALCHRAQDKED